MNFDKKNNGFRTSVYLMLALSVILLGIIFYVVGSNQKLFDSKYSIFMFKHDAESLIPGAFITLSGMKVGVVGKMQLSTHDENQGVTIELKIDKDYANFITTSSVAQIKTMGMLGDKYVDISLGRSNEKILQKGDYIKSKVSVNIDKAISDAAISLSELKGVLKNLNVISKKAIEGKGTIGQLVSDEQMANDLKATIHNLRSTSRDLKMGKGSAGKLLRDSSLYIALLNTTTQLEDITGRLSRGEGSVGEVLADTTFFKQIKTITTQADTLVKKLNGNGTVGTLIKDKEYYDELLRLTKELRELTEDIKKNPGKYGSFSIF
jgi:phospholipid/cholesterol/gamma-HCH transport system substrate-binding protein